MHGFLNRSLSIYVCISLPLSLSLSPSLFLPLNPLLPHLLSCSSSFPLLFFSPLSFSLSFLSSCLLFLLSASDPLPSLSNTLPVSLPSFSFSRRATRERKKEKESRKGKGKEEISLFLSFRCSQEFRCSEQTTDARQRQPSLALTAGSVRRPRASRNTSRTIRVLLLPNGMPHPAPCTQWPGLTVRSASRSLPNRWV